MSRNSWKGGSVRFRKRFIRAGFSAPPCTPEFRHLNEVRLKVPAGQATLIGINAFENWGGVENPARMKRFLRRTAPDFQLLHGNKAILEAFGGITRIPTVIVFDRSGKEIWRFVHIKGAKKQFATTAEIIAALGLESEPPLN